MTRRHRETIHVTTSVAVQRSGLSGQVIEECVERRLVREPLSRADLIELRRIRRLQLLGVNMPGIEVVLHMRRRMQALQTELARWQQLRGADDWTEPGTRWQRLLSWEQDGE